MKKLLLGLAVISLSGCSLLDAYLMAKYDPNEYALITKIRHEAKLSKDLCDNYDQSKLNAKNISHSTQMFVLYSDHIPRNNNLIDASKNLDSIAKGLDDQYTKNSKVSPTFCKVKFQNIETSAEKIQEVIAGRPR